MAHEPGKIRNVAVVGHRGTGKTSLVEAMLFQSGATNRLGTIEAGSTVSDWDEDEQRRKMSLAATICHLEWHDRKINLIDTPGDAGFVGDAIAAIRVVEGALFVVSGVMGVEVQTSRNWKRAADGEPLARPLREHARPRARGLLPRPRRAAGAALRALRRDPPADRRGARVDAASSTSCTCARTRARRASARARRPRFPPSCRRRSTSTTRSCSTPSSRPTRSSWSATSTVRSSRSRRSRTR